ncbi:MAG: hypothetical protein NOOUEUKL_002318 [Candidatus Fervidibacter sp.]
MMVANVGTLTVRRQIGISLIEVITAIAILAVGIWAIVTLFPRGQDIIRRSGLRQQATQLAHEAISDFLADPIKMPFAIVPFNPANPQIANRPVLLEPADLLTVRYTYNLVWGEPLDDGLPPGDPNKQVGLVWIDLNGNNIPEPGVDEWRAILRFAPATIYRVYREVEYRRAQSQSGLQEFEFFFDPQGSKVDVYLSVDSGIRPNGLRVLRVSYELEQQVGPITQIWREAYIVPEGLNQFRLNQPASRILQIVEEFPLVPDNDPQQFPAANDLDNEFVAVGSTLRFVSPVPPLGFIRQVVGIPLTQDRLGPLRADYLIEDLDGDGRFAEDPADGQDNDSDGQTDEDAGGHWIVETGTTFDPDPTLKQQGVSSVFQTTFGGINSPPFVLSIMPPPQWGNPVDAGRGLLNVDAQTGLLAFSLPVGTRLRVAYRAGDDPNTPSDESWFLQVIKPPDDFQFQPDPNASPPFPFERLRWFNAQLIPDDPNTLFIIDPYFLLQFSPLLGGLNVQVRYQVRYFNPSNPSQTLDETYTEVKGISSNGIVTFPIPPRSGWSIDTTNTKIEEVRGASLLVRVSGGSMWRQSPPKTRADYVELATIIPTPAKAATP